MTTDREQGPPDGSTAEQTPEEVLDEREYFLTGQWHVEHVFGLLRRVFDPSFRPLRVLDIGCGRGRVTLALAGRVERVAAVEPNFSWITQARRHAQALGLTNIDWMHTGSDLSGVQGCFDLVHACVTPERLDAPLLPDLARLAQLLTPRGLAAVHVSLHEGTPGGPAAALQSLRYARVRQCHVELGVGRDRAGAMLYFAAGDVSA